MSKNLKGLSLIFVVLVFLAGFLYFNQGSEAKTNSTVSSEKADTVQIGLVNSTSKATAKPAGESFSITTAKREACIKCHDGIEDIAPNEKMAAAIAASGKECTICHFGNGSEAVKKEIAHKNMVRNPSSLDYVTKTCGQCHEKAAQNVEKSLHSTMAGMISGARYTWGAQKEKLAIYGVRPVQDKDGNIPNEQGALKELKLIPFYSKEDAVAEKKFSSQAEISKHPVDSYLRKECLRCHIWTKGKDQKGDYRADGCAACHVIYDDNGLSKTEDKTVKKDAPGHPIKHKITTKIPPEQCIHCHNRGNRIGVSYIGTMEADYKTPFKEDGSEADKLHGKNYNHLEGDIHFQKGMTCIDCHDSTDIMGDGNIYSKKWQQNKTRCEKCHGTKDGEGKTEITLKLTGQTLKVPQIYPKAVQDKHIVAMSIPKHMEKLSCNACHSKWTPQCYGCHAKFDEREKQKDILTGQETTGKWEEGRSFLRWEGTILGINPKGKVSPYIPGCQAIFTHIDKNGKTLALNKVFMVNDPDAGKALPGWALNPAAPHTVQRNAKTCEDCHNSRKALGLGEGYYNAKDNGISVDIDPTQLVKEDGTQVQTISHPGARPFTVEEMNKINRNGTCLGCHAKTTNKTYWDKVRNTLGYALTPQYHSEIVGKLLDNTMVKLQLFTAGFILIAVLLLGFKLLPRFVRGTSKEGEA